MCRQARDTIKILIAGLLLILALILGSTMAQAQECGTNDVLFYNTTGNVYRCHEGTWEIMIPMQKHERELVGTGAVFAMIGFMGGAFFTALLGHVGNKWEDK